MTNTNLTQRLADYRPSKGGLLWSCAASAILTMIIGFSWGGWTTAGTANNMTKDAAANARAELVANACVAKFRNSPDFPSDLSALKQAKIWNRAELIQKNGWVTLAGMSNPLHAAANICANELVKMEAPAAANAEAPTIPKADEISTPEISGESAT